VNVQSIQLVLLIGCVGLSTNLAAAAPPPDPNLLEYLVAHRDRRYEEAPREVLAFYYTWYGRPENEGGWLHWGGEEPEARDIPESTHFPARGAYDSLDPAIVDDHIEEAKTHGLTGFISTWWVIGDHQDRAFQLLLDRAKGTGFKATVYWETVPGEGQEQINRAVEDLVYILKRYGSHPAFLTVEGKPAIFAYVRVMDQVPPASWPTILTRARAQAGDFLLLADGYRENYARVFDGIHNYNPCAQVSTRAGDELRVWAGEHYAAAVRMARRRGKVSCVTVIPGYDDRKIRTPGVHAPRRDGETYRILWEEAIRAAPDWVLITSWNEWHEGSEIEPSWEHGDAYLKWTADHAPRFLAGAPAPPEPAPTSPPDVMREVQALFAGRPIGVLPGLGGAGYWLVDVGLPMRELSWAEVADPQVLNPGRFPLLLHAGGEEYSSRGRTDGDVIPALQRYLAEGGFLVCFPWKPLPFYYDRGPDLPGEVAGQIGIPVQYGWEQPPDGVRLSFRFDTEALPGLPDSASFPATGDLRWRPARRQAVHPDDHYQPLASLVDEHGRTYGDGIAYVRHTTPPLQGGQTLYVWMRMHDVTGDHHLMPALLRFVAERLPAPPPSR